MSFGLGCFPPLTRFYYPVLVISGEWYVIRVPGSVELAGQPQLTPPAGASSLLLFMASELILADSDREQHFRYPTISRDTRVCGTSTYSTVTSHSQWLYQHNVWFLHCFGQ